MRTLRFTGWYSGSWVSVGCPQAGSNWTTIPFLPPRGIRNTQWWVNRIECGQNQSLCHASNVCQTILWGWVAPCGLFVGHWVGGTSPVCSLQPPQGISGCGEGLGPGSGSWTNNVCDGGGFGFSCGHMVSVYAVAVCSVSINIGRVLYGKSLFLCGDLGVSWTYRGIFGTICPLQGALRGEGVHSLLGIGFLLCLSQMY